MAILHDGVRDREIGAAADVFLDPARLLAVSMRIMRKSTGVSTDLSVTCQRAESPRRTGFGSGFRE